MEYLGIEIGPNWKPFRQERSFRAKQLLFGLLCSAAVGMFFYSGALFYVHAATRHDFWDLVALFAVGVWVLPVAAHAVLRGLVFAVKGTSPRSLGIMLGCIVLPLAMKSGYVLWLPSLAAGWKVLLFPFAVFLVPFLVCDLLLALTKFHVAAGSHSTKRKAPERSR